MARGGLPITEAHKRPLEEAIDFAEEADYDLSGQCVPAMVAQWAVEPGGKDAHFFLLGPPLRPGPEMKTLPRRKKRTRV